MVIDPVECFGGPYDGEFITLQVLQNGSRLVMDDKVDKNLKHDYTLVAPSEGLPRVNYNGAIHH
jgi:hypothetical protein